MLKVRGKRRGELEQVDVVLVARVCHLVWWQLCKLPLWLLHALLGDLGFIAQSTLR